MLDAANKCSEQTRILYILLMYKSNHTRSGVVSLQLWARVLTIAKLCYYKSACVILLDLDVNVNLLINHDCTNVPNI